MYFVDYEFEDKPNYKLPINVECILLSSCFFAVLQAINLSTRIQPTHTWRWTMIAQHRAHVFLRIYSYNTRWTLGLFTIFLNFLSLQLPVRIGCRGGIYPFPCTFYQDTWQKKAEKVKCLQLQTGRAAKQIHTKLNL